MSDRETYTITTDKERTYTRASKAWKLDEEAKLMALGLVKVMIDLPGGHKGSFWKRADTTIKTPTSP